MGKRLLNVFGRCILNLATKIVASTADFLLIKNFVAFFMALTMEFKLM